MLSGLEAINCTMAQATAHEIINAGCMAQGDAFGLLPGSQNMRNSVASPHGGRQSMEGHKQSGVQPSAVI